MEQNKEHRFNLIGFLALIGMAFGFAYGIVESSHLSWVYKIVCFCAVLLVAWLIWRSGAASSYANAQAWANAKAESYANASAEAIASAVSKSEAIAEASARAIASATATNTTIIHLARLGTPELLYDAVHALAKSADEDLRQLTGESLQVLGGVAPAL